MKALHAKRLIMLAATVLLTACMLPTVAFAATIFDSGSCGSELTWSFDDEGLLSIEGSGRMPDYSIASQTPWYSYHDSITTVSIAPGVTHVGSAAFGRLSALTSITIPEGVTGIGDLAFNNCTALESVSLPSSLWYIGLSPFFRCPALKSFTVAEGSPYFYTDGRAIISSDNELVCYANASVSTDLDNAGSHSYTIPENVVSIRRRAFANCSSLESVVIPDSVTSVESTAFSDCTSLESVALPSSITSLGTYVFSDCTGLTSVSVSAISCGITQGTFSGCTALQSVHIDEGLPAIYREAFMGCKALTQVNIPKSVKKIGTFTFDGCSSLRALRVPASVTFVGKYAFRGLAKNSTLYVGTMATYNTIADSSDYLSPAKTTVFVDLSACSLSLPYEYTVYSGKEKKPRVTVKLGSEAVPADGYTVEYENNIEVGTATVIVCAAANSIFSGTATTTFAINEKPDNFIVSKTIAAVNYNGSITKAAYPIKKVTGAIGPLEYEKVSGSKYLSITTKGTTAGKHTGKVTVAPKTPVGKHQMVMRITDTATGLYKDVTVSVQVMRITPTITVTKKVTVALNYGPNKTYEATMIKAVQCAAKPLKYTLVSFIDQNGFDYANNSLYEFMPWVDEKTGTVTVSDLDLPPGTYKIMLKIWSPAVDGYNANWRTATGTLKIVQPRIA